MINKKEHQEPFLKPKLNWTQSLIFFSTNTSLEFALLGSHFIAFVGKNHKYKLLKTVHCSELPTTKKKERKDLSKINFAYLDANFHLSNPFFSFNCSLLTISG